MRPEEIAEMFCPDCTVLAYTTDFMNAWGWELDSCGLDKPMRATTLAELEPMAVAAAQSIQAESSVKK